MIYGNCVEHQYTWIDTNNMNKTWTPKNQMDVNALFLSGNLSRHQN